MRFPVGLILALVSSSANVRADVLTVGPSGADFTQIKTAVQAAADGDAILVKAGTYDGFLVDDKALRIVNVSAASVLVQGVVRVHDLSPGKTLVLSGIDVQAEAAEGLIVFASAGAVRVQDGDFLGGPGDYLDYDTGIPGYAGAKVVASADVVFERCTLTGGHGNYGLWDYFIPNSSGGDGLQSEGSRVAVFASTTIGGDGGWYDEHGNGLFGGHGVSAIESDLFLSGCSLQGGNGGGGGEGSFFDYAGSGGDGGNGLEAVGSSARLYTTLLSAGVGGPAGSGYSGYKGSPGYPGQEIHADGASSVSEHGGVTRRLEGPWHAPDDSSVELTVEGKPGDEVYIVASSATDYRLEVARRGVWLLGDDALPQARSTASGGGGALVWPTRSGSHGTIGAGGTLTLSRPVADVPPGVAASTLFLQAVMVRPSGKIALSDLLVIEVVD